MSWNGSHHNGVAQIAESIQADIVHGRVQTGQELVLAELSERADASMTDVRQALLRLVDQHLITESANGAFHVVSTSREDLRELTAMRQLLEGEAVRLSTLLRTEASAERLHTAFRALQQAGTGTRHPGLSTGWREAHAAFHDALCADCGNERLIASVRSLRDEAEIYRELSSATLTSERQAAVEREHRELLDLALAGDAEGAASSLRAHLEGTMRSVAELPADEDPA